VCIRDLAVNRGATLASTLASALLILGLAGCGTEAPFEGTISARPSTVVQLSWVRAKRTADGVRVWGQIQQAHCCASLHGYIHFEAIDPSGAIIATSNAPWGEFNARQLHSAWFKAELPMTRERAVSRIDMEFSAEARR
jgi:hypothetical protein